MIRLVMLGDIVGRVGRQAVTQLVPTIRERWRPDVLIANAENASSGSGLNPQHYDRLIKAGLDGVTLGDHVFRRQQIAPVLEKQPNIVRPCNLPAGAAGRGWMQLDVVRDAAADVSVCVITVLGRILITLPVDEPFAAIERTLKELRARDPIVLLEVHAETTSEKQAIGRRFDGRVAAVVGTHTHVPTADACILPRGTGFICDLGMCGPHESILGRQIEPVIHHFTTSMHAAFEVAEHDPRINGIYLEIDETTKRTRTIERIELRANPNQPPFVA